MRLSLSLSNAECYRAIPVLTPRHPDRDAELEMTFDEDLCGSRLLKIVGRLLQESAEDGGSLLT